MAKPGELHARLAAIEAIQLYVTTNYDDVLERAVASHRPRKRDRPHMHVLVDRLQKGLAISTDSGPLETISRTGKDLDQRLANPQTGEPTAPIVFKMHGSIDRKEPKNDSYLITEGDYVDYLGRDQGNYVPPYIDGLMEGKNFLFLGYSLEDWNVRVILSKLLSRIRPHDVRCWAIVLGRSEAEQRIWQSQSLNIYPMDLLKFSNKLAAELDRAR